jgi:transcriptional regulator with XRE-family HTH domain
LLPVSVAHAPRVMGAKSAHRRGGAFPKVKSPRATKIAPAQAARLSQADDSDADAKVGAVIRKLRLHYGWSLSELALRCSLSVSMLSQIERGLSTPSLRSLRLLAVSLETSVVELFEGETNTPKSYIVRNLDRKSFDFNGKGVFKAVLTPSGPGLVELWEFCVAPGGTTEDDLYNQPGEKAGVLLSGQLRLWIDDVPMTLGPGDSFRFSSLLKHKVDNPFTTEARIIWFVTPPIANARKRGAE